MASSIANASARASVAGTLSGSSLIDPYEIAYLRGGAREVLKLRLFELMQLGYLAVYLRSRARWRGYFLGVNPDAKDLSALPQPDRTLLVSLETPLPARQFLNRPYPPELLAACDEYRRDLDRLGLLDGWISPEGVIAARAWFLIAGALILFVYLSLQFGVVGFLSIFAAVIIVLLLIARPSALYRPSAAGRRYLKRLAAQYAGYRTLDGDRWLQTPHAAQLALVGILGFRILKGSPADALAIAFKSPEEQEPDFSVSVGGGCGGCGG